MLQSQSSTGVVHRSLEAVVNLALCEDNEDRLEKLGVCAGIRRAC